MLWACCVDISVFIPFHRFCFLRSVASLTMRAFSRGPVSLQGKAPDMSEGNAIPTLLTD